MNKSQVLKAYSIKDVSKKISVPTGTIRQWEKDLNGLLVIPRSRQGARFYTETEISILAKIKEMREKNLSKGMIRMLLEKHFNEGSEAASESFGAPATVEQSLIKQEQAVAPQPVPNMEEFQAALETYKQNLIKEIKLEIKKNQMEIIEEVKNGIHEGTIRTVQGLSKSIQRSNEKRKSDLNEITQSISEAARLNSDTFASLSDTIAKTSKGTYEQLSQQISESSKTATKDYKSMLYSASSSLDQAQKDMIRMTKTLQEDQENFVETITQNFEQLGRTIQQREDVFQDMVTSYREVAAAKKTKKWWKVF
ncbi:DNA-binding transcriptional MerR regulator [Peribacillus deserti]|uniref:DNA-binding transcriptional MerR regulator n=1 Tax=Peribacillus deserti TaxID=673318 RepID=A0ABS2QFG6_9BACI|nr:MerR family transcriptional regulator [Peribacillus deserti]MBM7691268.1 DNA-binding transcriptional MerR regulator [Peribacillus deserti]